MTINGLPRQSSVATVQELVDERQLLVARVEAANEADRRTALELDRERAAIFEVAMNGSFLARLTVKRRTVDLGRRLARALADRQARAPDMLQMLERVRAIDALLKETFTPARARAARRNHQPAATRH